MHISKKADGNNASAFFVGDNRPGCWVSPGTTFLEHLLNFRTPVVTNKNPVLCCFSFFAVVV